MAGIGEERIGQVELPGEHDMAIDAVGRNTKDQCALFLEGSVAVAQRTGFNSATGRVVFRIEEEHDSFAFPVRGIDGSSVGLLEAERG